MTLNLKAYPPISPRRPNPVFEVVNLMDDQQYLTLMAHDEDYYLVDLNTVRLAKSIQAYASLAEAFEAFVERLPAICEAVPLTLEGAPNGTLVTFVDYRDGTYRASMRKQSGRFKVFSHEGVNRRAGSQRAPITKGNYTTLEAATAGFINLITQRF